MGGTPGWDRCFPGLALQICYAPGTFLSYILVPTLKIPGVSVKLSHLAGN